jgi:hypothetical protein
LKDVEILSTLGSCVGIYEVGVIEGLRGGMGSYFTSLSGSNSSTETSLSILWRISRSEDTWIGYEVLRCFTLGFPLAFWVLFRKDPLLN